jgi:hypothetical protein
MIRPLRIALFFATFSVIAVPALLRAQAPTGLPTTPQVFIEGGGEETRMPGEKGLLGFERTRVDFMTQGTGIENCANVPITNTTDHPRLLTKLTSHDPATFYISSPSEMMLPLTIGANSTLFINVCFKPADVRAYHTEVIARFGDDSSVLVLDGKGVKAPAVQPIPKETKILSVKKGKHDWTIDVGLSVHSVIRLAIEDAMAHKIRTFPFDDTKVPGIYQVTFDGKDDLGKKIAKGTYYLRLEVVNRENNTTIHDTKTIAIK